MSGHLCFLVAVSLASDFDFDEVMVLVNEWITNYFWIERLNQRQDYYSSGHHGLAGFSSLVGSYAGVLKRVAGVGGGARTSRTFFCVFVTLGNRKESSKHFGITASICQSHTIFSWHRFLCGK